MYAIKNKYFYRYKQKSDVRKFSGFCGPDFHLRSSVTDSRTKNSY